MSVGLPVLLRLFSLEIRKDEEESEDAIWEVRIPNLVTEYTIV